MPAACSQAERTDICPSKRRRIQRNSTHSTLDATSAQKRAEELGRKTIPADQFWKGFICLEWQKSIGLNSMSFSSGQETIM